MSDPGDPVWDCNFQYSIRPKVRIKNVIDTPKIKLIRNTDGYVEGFEVSLNNTTIPGAERESEKLGHCLENILTIKSGMTIDAWLSSFERKDSITGQGWLGATQRHSYDIEGGIDTLDLSNPSIQNILNSGTSINLANLSDAVSHLGEGRYRDSIKTAFWIIEGNKSIKGYYKFDCIRNILTHKTLYKNVINNFKLYFGPNVNNAFDFKKYEPNMKIINLDFESKKTRKTLNNIAMDLINECKSVLGL